MSDRRKFTLLAGSSVLLALLVMTYEPAIAPKLSAALDASKRQRHYEQAIMKKGLTLHEGAFWKTKE